MTRSRGGPQIVYCSRQPLPSLAPGRSTARRPLGSPERPRVQAVWRGSPSDLARLLWYPVQTPQEDWMCSKTRRSQCYASEMEEAELRPRCGGYPRLVETGCHKHGHLCAPVSPQGPPSRMKPGARILSHPEPAPSPGQFPSSWGSQGAEYSPPSTRSPIRWRHRHGDRSLESAVGKVGGATGPLETRVRPDSARPRTDGQVPSPHPRNAVGGQQPTGRGWSAAALPESALTPGPAEGRHSPSGQDSGLSIVRYGCESWTVKKAEHRGF